MFAAINAVLAAYAIVAFVGVRNSLVDIWSNVFAWLHKPQKFEPTPSRPAAGRWPKSADRDPALSGIIAR